MTISLDVNDLEREIKYGNFNISDRIASIRNFILFNSNDHILPNEGKAFAIKIWNLAVRIQRMLPEIKKKDNYIIQSSTISSIRLLAVDIYQKYMDQSSENDGINFLNMLVYSYKSLINLNDISRANQYLEYAFSVYSHLQPTSHSALFIVQLTIWQAQFEIEIKKDYENALAILKRFSKDYKIESSVLVSFVYEISLESQSLDWINYGLTLVTNSSLFADQWVNRIKSLLAKYYINNNEPENAIKIILDLPNSPQSIFLELECSILLSPKEETLKAKLISFVSQSMPDTHLLDDLCIFVANHSVDIGNASIEFIKNVMNRILTIPEVEIREHICVCAIQIVSDLNDIETTSVFLKMINEITNEEKKEISAILWNKALDMYDINDYDKSVQWMQLSRSQVNDNDNISQSCYFRFICRCFFEAKKYSEALSFANDAIQRLPNCSHGYLLKFRILVKLNNKNDAFALINDIINNLPYADEFDPSFFTSVAAEIHSIGNNNLALETLLKLYELNFNSNRNENLSGSNKSGIQITILKNIKKKTINSIFSLLQEIDDISYISKSINRISSRWNSQVIYKIKNNEIEENCNGNDSLLLSFSSNDIIAYAAIAFQNGMELKKRKKWKKAVKSFINGTVFSGDIIESKVPCVFEAVNCYINLYCDVFINNPNDNQSNSPLLLAQSLIDEISPIIEESTNADSYFKDGLLLSKVKILIILLKKQSREEYYKRFQRLIELIKSPHLLFEACNFMCEHKSDQELFHMILERAKNIDQTSFKKISNDESPLPLFASVLYKLVTHSKTLEESRKSYDIAMNFLQNGNSTLISTSQLQFFMSYAWNIGVQCARSLRSKEGEFWFSTALTIIGMSDDLKSQYGDELNEKYLQFLVHHKSRIAFSF